VEIAPKPPTAKGPADWFTGDVWIERLVEPREPSRLSVSAVRFGPGARTAWHSHAVGQTLYVTDGEGRIQSRDRTEPIATIRAGDVVLTPPGEWHWHGAAPDRFMAHLSMTEGPVEWGEHVTEEEYRGGA
jgi:quercetin dioxygenase-like cupin family protein